MKAEKSDIVLATINAKYHHSSLALRTLLANLGGLSERACIAEFSIGEAPDDVAEQLLRYNPKIIGLSVYIWNVTELTETLSVLKKVKPEVVVVVGGPEVSHEAENQKIVSLADFVVQGEGEDVFRNLCAAVLEQTPRPAQKILAGGLPDLNTIVLPYALYSAEDIAHRTLYMEASRGCPYKCEFCLSSLDQQVRHFPVEKLLAEMEALIARGARTFKFIDRTFNLKLELSQQILQFFLDRHQPGMLFHFEMVPDRLPEQLRSIIAQFPAGSLQFEVGVQTLNDDVAKRISRRQNVAKMRENLAFLRNETGVHVHADLIIGLPGESAESFAAGLNDLWNCGPQEIQVGILKRLRGAPIARHTETHQMKYSDFPPYEVLQTDAIPWAQMQQLKRFAFVWDRLVNRGNLQSTVALLFAHAQPFEAVYSFSGELFRKESRVHAISLDRLAGALRQYLLAEVKLETRAVEDALAADYERTGRNMPASFRTVDREPRRKVPLEEYLKTVGGNAHRARQDRHARQASFAASPVAAAEPASEADDASLGTIASRE